MRPCPAGYVFDVSSSDAYHKGEGYNCLAGRDASRALAVMSLHPEDCVSKVDDITEDEAQVLEDWLKFLRDKKGYPLVGTVPGLLQRGCLLPGLEIQ
jgi:membrane-associated progesterone receptor component